MYKINKNELYHHGILGMKWGKQNGPPYPLGASQHSSSEKAEGTKGWTKKAKAETKTKTAKTVSDINDLNDLEKHREELVSYYKKENPKKAKEYSKMSEAELAKDKARKDKAKKIIIATAAVAGVSAGVYLAYKYGAIDRISESIKSSNKTNLNSSVKKAMHDSLDDIDYIFKTGHEFHRQVGFKNFDVKAATGATYVSTDKADTAAYKTLLVDWSGTGKRYDVSLKGLKDIKAPSDKKARQIFDNLFDTNDAYKRELARTLAENTGIKPSSPFFDKTANLLYDEINQMSRDKAFEYGIYSIVKQKSDSKMLINEYKKAGYDAVVDYFDKGAMAKLPLILFNASSDVVKTGEKAVDLNDFKESIDLIAQTKGHPSQFDARLIKWRGAYKQQYDAVFGKNAS